MSGRACGADAAYVWARWLVSAVTLGAMAVMVLIEARTAARKERQSETGGPE